MTKLELINTVTQECECSKKIAAAAVESVSSAITDALAKGGGYTHIGFGTFSVGERAERKGRNIQTGEEITIPAHKVVKFISSKNLKEAVK